MSDEQVVTAETTETSSETVEKPPEMVEKGRLDHAIGDLHRYKSQVKDLQTKLASVEEQKLKEREDWKSLYEIEKEARTNAELASNKTQESYLAEKKFSAIKEAALRFGIRPEALDDLSLLSLDQVQIESTSTGRLNVLGADTAVQELKRTRPYWFSDNRPPNVNTTTVGVGPQDGPVTWQTLQKLEREGKKSGDMSAYKQAYTIYNKQRGG